MRPGRLFEKSKRPCCFSTAIRAGLPRQAILDAGYRTVTPVVVTNADEYTSFRLLRTGDTVHGADVLSVE